MVLGKAMRYTAFSTVTQRWYELLLGVASAFLALVSGICLERIMPNKVMWSDEIFGSGCVGVVVTS